MKGKLIAGVKPKSEPTQASLKEIVGKTVSGVVQSTVEGAHGKEPVIYIVFSDGTQHGFVLPTDE